MPIRGVSYVPLALEWKTFRLAPENNGFALELAQSSNIIRRLARILGEWERTPYNTAHANKGIGIYCSAFVCRVLDELYRRPETEMPTIPHDISFHNREGAMSGLRWFMRQFPACRRILDGVVEPGDVLITGPVGGGPGHAMMVGPRENTLWQATGKAGVHYTGFALPEIYQLHAAYRFEDREVWK